MRWGTACCPAAAQRLAHAPAPAPALAPADVQVGKGPVVVTHAARNTGHETKKPYDWGPLGGW